MEGAKKEELVKGIQAALIHFGGHLMYDLYKIAKIAADFGKTLNDINIVAMWTVENSNRPFTLKELDEPSWFKELCPTEQEAARVLLQKHVEKAGSPQ